MILDYFKVTDPTFTADPTTYMYSDISFTMRYDVTRFLKACGQMSVTIPITGRQDAFYEVFPFNAGIGLILNLNLGKKPATDPVE